MAYTKIKFLKHLNVFNTVVKIKLLHEISERKYILFFYLGYLWVVMIMGDFFHSFLCSTEFYNGNALLL